MREERAYWTHEIAESLSISDSTLRKWCLELERHGYVFVKGENNSRAFLVRDLDLLARIKHYVRVENLTIEQAVSQSLQEFEASTTVIMNSTNAGRSSVTPVVREPFEQELKLLNERMEKQEEFNKKLMQRLEERDRNLMAVLREVQETNKRLAERRNKKWWKFWK